MGFRTCQKSIFPEPSKVFETPGVGFQSDPVEVLHVACRGRKQARLQQTSLQSGPRAASIHQIERGLACHTLASQDAHGSVEF